MSRVSSGSPHWTALSAITNTGWVVELNADYEQDALTRKSDSILPISNYECKTLFAYDDEWGVSKSFRKPKIKSIPDFGKGFCGYNVNVCEEGYVLNDDW